MLAMMLGMTTVHYSNCNISLWTHLPVISGQLTAESLVLVCHCTMALRICVTTTCLALVPLSVRQATYQDCMRLFLSNIAMTNEIVKDKTSNRPDKMLYPKSCVGFGHMYIKSCGQWLSRYRDSATLSALIEKHECKWAVWVNNQEFTHTSQFLLHVRLASVSPK